MENHSAKSSGNWLEKVLEKPLAYRKKLALFLTIVIGFLIVSIWLFITSYQIKKAVFEEEFQAAPDPTKASEELPEESKGILPNQEISPDQLKESNEIFK